MGSFYVSSIEEVQITSARFTLARIIIWSHVYASQVGNVALDLIVLEKLFFKDFLDRNTFVNTQDQICILPSTPYPCLNHATLDLEKYGAEFGGLQLEKSSFD